MQQYIEYAVTWFFFMGIIAVICLLVPRIAPKIGKIFKGKTTFKNPYDFGEESEKDTDENDSQEK